MKAESGEVLDEKEHDSAELGFMFEAGDEDDDDEDEVSRADFLKTWKTSIQHPILNNIEWNRGKAGIHKLYTNFLPSMLG